MKFYCETFHEELDTGFCCYCSAACSQRPSQETYSGFLGCEKTGWLKLKNEILLNPQPYLNKGVTIADAAVDHHNTGAATIKLKDATDRFFYIKTRLANSNEVILHVGRYKDSGKLYLYAASHELPEYARTSQ
ncbi:MAG: hypothetical protein K5882_08055 [Bacteroidales bacterium]|nr:hypothetical protein [Bacteroidales bacterium]